MRDVHDARLQVPGMRPVWLFVSLIVLIALTFVAVSLSAMSESLPSRR
jgi:hypothetical protein